MLRRIEPVQVRLRVEGDRERPGRRPVVAVEHLDNAQAVVAAADVHHEPRRRGVQRGGDGVRVHARVHAHA